MDIANFFTDMQSLFTLVSFATFVGIMIWAFSGKRKRDFEEAAQLPFADDSADDFADAAMGRAIPHTEARHG